MWEKLNQPLWPAGRLSLTTPLSLLLTLGSVVAGVVSYARGYTYEGAALIYMLGGVCFTWPYYRARYTGWMTALVLMSLVPIAIWLQNKGVENVAWHYRSTDGYWLWLTQTGQGWGRWTRHFWLGNEMPAMEYVFYPGFGIFQMSVYSLYSHVLPDHWFEEPQRHLKYLFPAVYLPLLGAFIAAYVIYQPQYTDYLYGLTALGFVITIAAYAGSPNYRRYTQSPAFWYWTVGMGIVFMTSWEFVHSCWNHDWVYNPARTFPPLYSYRGAPMPISECFGYISTAMTFQAIMLMLIRRFGNVVIKNYDLVPFSKP
jgi:hypothetical protein